MILVVEDSQTFGKTIQHRLETKLDTEVLWLKTYAETKAALEEDASRFSAAILDLTLPDAPHGEVVDLTTARQIPTVVLTANFDPQQRERMWAKKVCDYVLKRGPQDIDYVIALVSRLARNHETKILVVDDSSILRKHVVDLLRIHRYQVLEATDGLEALAVLKQHPDIKLIIADYAMPNMDGVELVERVRQSIPKDELCIIGISVIGDKHLSAMFIKNGANDFLYSPFLSEELYCRIAQNLELLESIDEIRRSASRDYLTGLFNRRYFFDVGGTIFANAKRGGVPIALAMIDADHFKNVNDTYGHDTGDKVLKAIAKALSGRLRESDILARFGGEEFCVLATNIKANQVETLFEAMRNVIASLEIPADDSIVHITASFGVCAESRNSLEEMIKVADEQLYAAKESGRNRVCIDRIATR